MTHLPDMDLSAPQAKPISFNGSIVPFTPSVEIH